MPASTSDTAESSEFSSMDSIDSMVSERMAVIGCSPVFANRASVPPHDESGSSRIRSADLDRIGANIRQCLTFPEPSRDRRRRLRVGLHTQRSPPRAAHRSLALVDGLRGCDDNIFAGGV